MKDYLEEGGHIVKSPREVIKQSFQDEIIKDAYLWMEALSDRSQATHLYDESAAEEIENSIRTKYLKMFKDLYEFFEKKQS